MAASLHFVEYIIFGLTLLISISIGIYFAKSGGKQKTLEEYLVGNRKISFCPIAVSLLVTFQSGISLLGLPVEIYQYGTQISMGIIGLVTGYVLVAVFFVPVFHPLQLTSVYEYLEIRFQSRAVRITGSVLGIMFTVMYMAVALFIPSLALEAVTNLSVWISIPLVAAVTVLYTMLGGMKAVVWTDVFQFLVMMAGITVLLVKGITGSGGLSQVWQTCSEQGRIQFFNTNPDPTARQTFWAVTLGTVTSWIGNGISQSGVQRMSSTSTIREARKAVLTNLPAAVILETLMVLLGMVLFAFYHNQACDPTRAGYIQSSNQLVPYFVMEQMSSIPGFVGLFMACLFSATLSTLSSGLSAVSALIWEDIVDPVLSRTSGVRGTFVTKVTVVCTGVVTVGIAFLAMNLKGTITQITIGTLSATSGPLVGVFLLGIILPWANAKSAIIGGFLSFCVCVTMTVGANFVPTFSHNALLPEVPISGCYVNTSDNLSLPVYTSAEEFNYTGYQSTSGYNTSATMADEEIPHYAITGMWIFRVSFLWYHLIGVLSTLIIGLLTTIITGGFSDIPAEPRFVLPCIRNMSCFTRKYHSRSSIFLRSYQGSPLISGHGRSSMRSSFREKKTGTL
ncbi:LOW QUALITY PROTEIN: sodium-coupled monocarboxylate transporter 1-like [Pecten maximus]|uniref:LOW QUALITY PROTEIN: sodium-coupled monocarboxylate transporter 1-like n=1 Tax=Pecten maximus TaxID=6579 RepID=UPI0014584287|nr:LOW QUALITY PROTEIN: sodium-coupled monocarboxylate transporter 1-like [Pecten maximus]